MHQLYNLTGNQVGAYFGHAICVSDVNGDGGDDIVIGTPLHTDQGGIANTKFFAQKVSFS